MADPAHSAQTHSFQAEVKQILDIVINSLYTHRDIFVRELISNASDALEKVRHEQLQNPDIHSPDAELNIKIEVSEESKTLTITDTGIGMTESEVVENLGTIAHSGTRQFLQKAAEAQTADVNLIGKFGVGFYSAFMVAKDVKVQTQSYRKEEPGVEWHSEGTGEYTIKPVGGLTRGTKIIIQLRDDAHEFANKDRIKSIINEYSNFVPFPILIDGEKVNTVQAVWAKNKSDITEEEYSEFYKFIGKAFDEPMFRMHFSADVPLQINALLYVPSENFERMGLGKLDPGVNLYCRKVLIQAQCDAILPDWLRFIKGVVDSEDLPLNISRETFQDDALIRKLKKVVTSRFLKFLKEKAEKEPEGYLKFWKTFNHFIKEGVATDFEYREDLQPLLRFESSKEEAGKLISLHDYVSRMRLGQDKIFYLNGPSHAMLETSPYMETFKKKGIEVLYLTESIDDFVMSSIQEFDGKKFVSIDQSDIDISEVGDPIEEKSEPEETKDELNWEEKQQFSSWLKEQLGDEVDAVRTSNRLVDSPAMIVNSGQGMTIEMQKMMKTMNQDMPGMFKHALEINMEHPIIKKMYELKQADSENPFLKNAVEHLYDTAKAAAGLVDDPRTMVNRNYDILQKALEK